MINSLTDYLTKVINIENILIDNHQEIFIYIKKYLLTIDNFIAIKFKRFNNNNNTKLNNAKILNIKV